ncbi:MAG: LCP family protein [Acidimicrobiales bacterium]
MTRHLARSATTDARRRRRKPRRSWGQRAALFGGAASALVLAGSAAGLGYLYRKLERIPRIELSGSLDEVADGGAPQNYLIVGIDNDEGVPEDDPIRNQRDGEQNTDTIMVVRIDPSSEEASILSFPRDLWVPYPDGSNHRINQAYVRGGRHPDLLIEILNDYFGIPIHHYVQVDFAGFYQLVDAIGGVPVYFPYPARDEHSGLAVFDTGCVTLDRTQAISYVRSRFYEELRPDVDDPSDTDWVSDGLSDIGRIQRQQDFIRRALERAFSVGARNPGTLNRLLDVAVESVTIDDELTPGAIFDLGRRFQAFETEALENFTVPTVGDRVGAAQILRMVESEAEPILARFRNPGADEDVSDDESDGDDSGDAPDIAPESVRLAVLNGTGAPGQATETADALAAAGFSVIGRRDADGDDLGQPRTIIRYPAGTRDQAELVALWLEADAELVELGADVSAEEAAASIEVITGADWAGVRSEPRSESSSDATDATAADPPDTTDDSTPPAEPPSSTTTTTPLPAC